MEQNVKYNIDNNRVHLCASCKKVFPECDAAGDDILIGCADNYCCCTKYEPTTRNTEFCKK